MHLSKLITVVTLAISVLAMPSPSRQSCPGLWYGTCDLVNSGTQVDIVGELTGSGLSPEQDVRPRHSDTPDAPTGATPPVQQCVPSPTDFCRGNYAVSALPDVTLADLASFAPTPPTLRTDPEGISLLGLPTIHHITAGVQEINGSLFDRAVTVRFTPSRATVDHGDGTVTTHTVTDAASYAYRQRGAFEATVTVHFSVAVRFTTAWRPVTGTVQATSEAYPIRIFEARSILVDRTCDENPAGITC